MRNAVLNWRLAMHQYDGIVAWAACELSGAAEGVSSMMFVYVGRGIGLVLAGLLAIGFGIPIKNSAPAIP